MEDSFKNGSITMSEFVIFNPSEDLNTIAAYINSRFTSGAVDYIGREKPFFNIVNAIRNIWFRATEIARKNIRMKAQQSDHFLLAFLANIHLRNWMRKSNFGQFLNDWGMVLATYNSAILKFVEKDGELIPSVVPWDRLICDFIDFDGNPKIEKLYFTPSQLKQNPSYNQELVELLIEAKSVRTTISGTQKDQKADYIEVYEVHGELPLSYLTDNEDDKNKYQQQMHAVSFVAKKDGRFDDYTLYAGREKRDPYMLTSLLPSTDGSISLDGAVKNTFEAQWMVNHNAKLIKDQLELASKIVFQTSDANFQGRNVLTNIENGEIMTYQPNQPLTMLNNKPDIVALQSFGQEWSLLANKINGVTESMMGANPPSGTAWRQTQALLQESHSLFDAMTKNRGLAVERMMRTYILPYLEKKMDTNKEIEATLESHEIKQIDSAFVPKEAIRVANEQIKTDILNGKLTQQPDMSAIKSQIQAKLNETGNQRFIAPSEIKTKTWKHIFKDFIWEVEVEVTGEETDKSALLQTLSTVMQTVASNPNVLQDPNARLIFNRILEVSGGFSPVELVQSQPQEKAPINRVSESLSYKDAPPDIQRQIEAQAGLKPSQGQQPVAPQSAGVGTGTGNNLALNQR